MRISSTVPILQISNLWQRWRLDQDDVLFRYWLTKPQNIFGDFEIKPYEFHILIDNDNVGADYSRTSIDCDAGCFRYPLIASQYFLATYVAQNHFCLSATACISEFDGFLLTQKRLFASNPEKTHDSQEKMHSMTQELRHTRGVEIRSSIATLEKHLRSLLEFQQISHKRNANRKIAPSTGVSQKQNLFPPSPSYKSFRGFIRIRIHRQKIASWSHRQASIHFALNILPPRSQIGLTWQRP